MVVQWCVCRTPLQKQINLRGCAHWLHCQCSHSPRTWCLPAANLAEVAPKPSTTWWLHNFVTLHTVSLACVSKTSKETLQWREKTQVPSNWLCCFCCREEVSHGATKAAVRQSVRVPLLGANGFSSSSGVDWQPIQPCKSYWQVGQRGKKCEEIEKRGRWWWWWWLGGEMCWRVLPTLTFTHSQHQWTCQHLQPAHSVARPNWMR